MENWDIIAKYLNNEADPAEKQEVEAWLKQDASHAALFEEIKLSWNTSGQIPNADFDVELALNSVHTKISKEDNVIPISGRKSSMKWILRVAAILVIAFFGTWVLIHNTPADMIVASTLNETRTITLADGSTIWLNKNTKVTYPEKFDENSRNIKLEGEAFFDVKRDPSKPFNIEGKDFNVKVLGTSFNVCETKNTVVVTVETGTVAFSSAQKGPLTLTKGEVGTYDRSKNVWEESTSYDLNVNAWRTHHLRFENSALLFVLSDIEGYFDTNIIVEDKTILNCKFTGSFPNAKLQDILKIMEGSLNIKVKTEKNRITISGKGCNE